MRWIKVAGHSAITPRNLYRRPRSRFSNTDWPNSKWWYCQIKSSREWYYCADTSACWRCDVTDVMLRLTRGPFSSSRDPSTRTRLGAKLPSRARGHFSSSWVVWSWGIIIHNTYYVHIMSYNNFPYMIYQGIWRPYHWQGAKMTLGSRLVGVKNEELW